MSDDVALRILTRFERASGDRGTWESFWEEVARRVLPSYAGSFFSHGNLYVPGTQRTDDMVDATAALALPKFAAAMESMLTPRAQTWHRLTTPDKMLMKNRIVANWFDDANDALFRYRYAPNANYASQQHEIYMGLGAFGTGCLFIDPLAKRWGGGLRYRAIHLGEIYFLENHQGIIDTAFRRFKLTARQTMQWFPTGLPEIIVKDAGDSAKQETEYWFVHCVQPREETDGYDPNRADVKGMAFASHYISETGKVRVLAGGREEGYATFPYAISRYVQAPGEVYGRSPSMLALPDIKVLNEVKRTVLKQGHRTVDPVLLAHDDGVLDGFNMMPGAINPGGVSADGRPLIHPLPVGNLNPADKLMELQRHVINDAFLVTLFQILVETPQMTATEVLERAREKGALLSPTMGRQQSEALGPMIHRELDVLSSQGLLPPMPPILKQAGGLAYDVVYESPLSRAQRAEGGAGFLRLVSYLQEIVALTQDPSPLDNIDFDAAIPDLAEMNAIKPAWLRSPDAIAAMRQQRAQQQQQQKLLDAAPSLAGVAKALPSVNLRGVAGAPA